MATTTFFHSLPDGSWKKGAPDLVGFEPSSGRETFWIPAHENNYDKAARGLRRFGHPREQIGICIHTAEEDANDYESTPVWFRNPDAVSSTGYYVDNDGDVVQMVRDHDYAWGQGVRAHDLALPRPYWWKDEFGSYNVVLLSIEIEGRWSTLDRSMPVGSDQWYQLANLCGFLSKKYGIPIDRDHFVGHDELAKSKSDPGPHFDWPAFMSQVKMVRGRSVRAKPPAVADDVGLPDPDELGVEPTEVVPPGPVLDALGEVAKRLDRMEDLVTDLDADRKRLRRAIERIADAAYIVEGG